MHVHPHGCAQAHTYTVEEGLLQLVEVGLLHGDEKFDEVGWIRALPHVRMHGYTSVFTLTR